ncbi:MAG: hypothetical protein JNK65_05200 [Deltaproteobacteria bacterium]|nr:hypothetical protein [Deltaproteobacteria bacterium]
MTPGDLYPQLVPQNNPIIQDSMMNRLQESSLNESAVKKRNALSILDEVSATVNQASAVLGFVSVSSSLIRPLRPLAAIGMNFLSSPPIAAMLLLSGAYSLLRQSSDVFQSTQKIFSSELSGLERWKHLLQVGQYGMAAAGVFVGLNAFGVGAKNYLDARQRLFAQKIPELYAHQMASIEADAVRRVIQDPQVWVQYARSSMQLSEAQSHAIYQSGKWLDQLLLKGSFGFGIARAITGAYEVYHQPQASISSWGELLLHFTLDVYPATTLLLYRGGRGNKNYEQGPALSQQLTEAVYESAEHRSWVLSKLEKGLPILSPEAEKAFVRQSHADLAQVEQLLQWARQVEAVHREYPPVIYHPDRLSSSASQAYHSLSPEQLVHLGELSVSELMHGYQNHLFSPLHLLEKVMHHPVAQNGAIFPRPFEGRLKSELVQLAQESTRRYQTGQIRPLEGVLVAVKDLFEGVDGVMHVGSKTSRFQGIGRSPIVSTLLEMGAIPVPVGMTAAANGGSGLHSSYGYIPHPTRPGYDPAGSSSATAYVVGLPDLPINIGIGTDTGGSITAPAGAVGLFGFVPPAGLLSTYNMIPFATFLDRIGVISKHSQDGLKLARLLTRKYGLDPHQQAYENPGMLFQPAHEKPMIVFLQRLLEAASPSARKHFMQEIQRYHYEGYEIIGLEGKGWDFLTEVPLLLYPLDAYPAAAFTHTNPFQRQRFEPPRRTLDENLMIRLPKGAIAIRSGMFDRARQLSHEFHRVVQEKLGKGVVLLSPSTESVATDLLLSGRAGNLLDGHDRITMAKNRIPNWGQVNLPSEQNSHVGTVVTGELPDLMVMLSKKNETLH